MSEKKATHYEILGVKPESTAQDIRSAFLDLSKIHHPDLNPNDPTTHKNYVRIMEAYTVLSKPELRITYDSHLHAWRKEQMSEKFDFESNAPRNMWRDETIWEMRDKEQDKFYEDRSYYGIKGLKRMSNLWIAGGAILLMATGCLFHFVTFKKTSAFTVSQLDRRDVRLGKQLHSTRKTAQDNGNTVQLELLEARLSTSSSPD